MDPLVALVIADPTTLAICQRALGSSHLQLRHYPSVDTILAALSDAHLDDVPVALVLDAKLLAPMPDKFFSALQHIQARVSILLVTADGAVDSAVNGMRLGATDCLELSDVPIQLSRRLRHNLAILN